MKMLFCFHGCKDRLTVIPLFTVFVIKSKDSTVSGIEGQNKDKIVQIFHVSDLFIYIEQSIKSE